MKVRERVLSAIELEEPDKVPLFDFLYEIKSYENILERKVPSLTPDIHVEGQSPWTRSYVCLRRSSFRLG